MTNFFPDLKCAIETKTVIGTQGLTQPNRKRVFFHSVIFWEITVSQKARLASHLSLQNNNPNGGC
jgi:hypothetical protein